MTSKEDLDVFFVVMNEKELENIFTTGKGWNDIAKLRLWDDIKDNLSNEDILLPTGIDSTKLILNESYVQREGFCSRNK